MTNYNLLFCEKVVPTLNKSLNFFVVNKGFYLKIILPCIYIYLFYWWCFSVYMYNNIQMHL